MKKLMLGLMMAFAATAAMAEGNVAEVISADGSVTGYETLQAALDAVAKPGAAFTNTVRLICNVTENVSLAYNKAAILDLNGFTLMGTGGPKSVIKINSDSALTLMDTSAKQTGTVTLPEGVLGPNDGGGVYNKGTFTLTGGTIAGCTANNGGGVNNSGTFTLSGGTITGCTAITCGGGVFNSSLGTFTMTGGTIAGCTAQDGGGVYNKGTFAMKGGAVENTIGGAKGASISGGLFGKEVVGDRNIPMWLASGAKTADNPDEATTNVYPKVVRSNTNCVLMVRMEGLLSVVVSNGTEAVAGYPAADYRIFEVASNATVSLAYVPAEGRELKKEAPTMLTVDKDMVVYPVKSLGPTCEGGTIEKDKEIGWVVTPTNGATKVVITGLAEGETVAGIRLGKFVVPSGAFDGFGEDGKTFSISLDETGEVTIGTETIPVQPTIGKGVENPFVLGEGDDGMLVAVTVMAIPGLQYTLWREGKAALLGGTDGWTDRPASAVAGATTVKLVDNKPPKGQAFYRITVSVP